MYMCVYVIYMCIYVFCLCIFSVLNFTRVTRNAAVQPYFTTTREKGAWPRGSLT